MKDLSELADILQRWGRLETRIADECSSYSGAVLEGLRTNLMRLERSTGALHRALTRRQIVMGGRKE